MAHSADLMQISVCKGSHDKFCPSLDFSVPFGREFKVTRGSQETNFVLPHLSVPFRREFSALQGAQAYFEVIFTLFAAPSADLKRYFSCK